VTIDDNNSIRTLEAVCPSPKRVIGGGYLSTAPGNAGSALVLVSNGPNAANTSWVVQARLDDDSGSYTVTAYAMCANVSP
jgi:hypothetical protein